MKKLFGNQLSSKIAIGLTGLSVIASIGFIKQPVADIATTAIKKKAAPPLKGADIEYKNYSINATRGLQIKYFETGSVITIPDSAFVDSEGKIVKGKVDIKYREFHDAVDFFISGIPMTYDSAGEKYHFESAGMLEMLAFQNGKPVFVNPEKRIVVEMASKQPEDKYNIYKFNPLQGNWNYIHKDKAIPVGNNVNGTDKKELSVLLEKASKLVKAIVPEELVMPVKSDEKKFHFDIAVDSLEYPELTSYKGVLFEIDNSEKDFDPLYASTIWTDVTLEKGKRNGSYLMTLSKGTEAHTFETRPVLSGVDYTEAFAIYKNKLKIRKNKEAQQQRIQDSLFRVMNIERVGMNSFAKNASINASAMVQTQDMIVRVFSISGFGIWNSDCPASMPKGEQFSAKFTDSLGKALTFHTVYLVEKGRNAMFTIYEGSNISYNPKKENYLWAVTADNKLAVFEEEDFKEIKIKNDSCAIKMKIINRPVQTKQQVKSILKI